jgi:hypothetical protein
MRPGNFLRTTPFGQLSENSIGGPFLGSPSDLGSVTNSFGDCGIRLRDSWYEFCTIAFEYSSKPSRRHSYSTFMARPRTLVLVSSNRFRARPIDDLGFIGSFRFVTKPGRLPATETVGDLGVPAIELVAFTHNEGSK